jgi:hypothetical protein
VALPKEEAKEYIEALDNVLRATAKFHSFDGDQFPKKLHPLDRHAFQIDILPLEQWENVSECPTSELEKLSKQCWELLDPIIGFVYDLKPQFLKQVFLNTTSKIILEVGSTPPSLAGMATAENA